MEDINPKDSKDGIHKIMRLTLKDLIKIWRDDVAEGKTLLGFKEWVTCTHWGCLQCEIDEIIKT